MSTVVEARGLVRRYLADGSSIRAVDGVDLVVEAGETVSVMGPSGCGKSTLLHLLGGLERPDAGELRLGGRRVDGFSETAWAIFRRRRNTPEPPPLTWGRVAIVAAVAFTVVLLGTIRPALRGIRQSTLRSLVAGPRPPRRPGRLGRLAASLGLPLPGVLGLRSGWRRPGRLLVNAAGLLLGVAMIVVALALRDSLDLLSLRPAEPGHAASDAAVAVLYDQIRAVIFATAGLLLALATINAIIVATFAARDAARNHAVLRAVGATPRQTVIALVVSQLGACAVAVGVSTSSLLLVAVAVPVAFAAIVSVPARLLARQPVAPLLTYE
jgi:energy-coupling factor transporter ATP-binding protein EcfA2